MKENVHREGRHVCHNLKCTHTFFSCSTIRKGISKGHENAQQTYNAKERQENVINYELGQRITTKNILLLQRDAQSITMVDEVDIHMQRASSKGLQLKMLKSRALNNSLRKTKRVQPRCVQPFSMRNSLQYLEEWGEKRKGKEVNSDSNFQAPTVSNKCL